MGLIHVFLPSSRGHKCFHPLMSRDISVEQSRGRTKGTQPPAPESQRLVSPSARSSLAGRPWVRDLGSPQTRESATRAPLSG